MSFPLYSLLLLLLPYLIRSSQILQNTLDQNPSESESESHNYIDMDYLDGCTAALGGYSMTYNPNHESSMKFSRWENPQPPNSKKAQDLPQQKFLGFFDYEKGIIKKEWVSGSVENGWRFNLRLYDGDYIDQKFALLQFALDDLCNDIIVNQSNATITTHPNKTINVQYGTNNQVSDTKEITGQLFLYFFEKNTHTPVTNFTHYRPDITKYTFQLSFITQDNSLSFTTPLFSESYFISKLDTAISMVFAVIYVIISLPTKHSSKLGTQVSTWSVRLIYSSSCYISSWILLRFLQHPGILPFVLIIAAMIDFGKHLLFLLEKDRHFKFSICLLIAAFTAALLWAPCIWVNLFPSYVLIIPTLLNFKTTRSGPRHSPLTRFQIGNWLSMCTWMGYAYYCPNNIYKISPKPMFAQVFLCIILAQFFIGLALKERQRRNRRQPLLPQSENINEENFLEESNHQYTFAAEKETEDYKSLIMNDECAICYGCLTEDQGKLYKTPCGHVFHEVCLRTWGCKKLDCPCCRKKLPRFQEPINS